MRVYLISSGPESVTYSICIEREKLKFRELHSNYKIYETGSFPLLFVSETIIITYKRHEKSPPIHQSTKENT